MLLVEVVVEDYCFFILLCWLFKIFWISFSSRLKNMVYDWPQNALQGYMIIQVSTPHPSLILWSVYSFLWYCGQFQGLHGCHLLAHQFQGSQKMFLYSFNVIFSAFSRIAWSILWFLNFQHPWRLLQTDHGDAVIMYFLLFPLSFLLENQSNFFFLFSNLFAWRWTPVQFLCPRYRLYDASWSFLSWKVLSWNLIPCGAIVNLFAGVTNDELAYSKSISRLLHRQ